jgi:hypothetical protein
VSRHLAIDLETLALAPSAAIAAIGYAVFDLDAGVVESGRVLLDWPKQRRTICPETWVWWSAQDDALRVQLAGEASLSSALAALRQTWDTLDGAPTVWCNGAGFDFPILVDAYAAYGGRPWPFRRERCARTALALMPGFEPERSGEKHDCEADARWTAAVAIEAMRRAAPAAREVA